MKHEILLKQDVIITKELFGNLDVNMRGGIFDYLEKEQRYLVDFGHTIGTWKLSLDDIVNNTTIVIKTKPYDYEQRDTFNSAIKFPTDGYKIKTPAISKKSTAGMLKLVFKDGVFETESFETIKKRLQ